MRQLWRLFIWFDICVSIALGMRCIECQYNEDDQGLSLEANKRCQDADDDESLLAPCDDHDKHCLSIDGLVNGNPAGLRQCVGDQWNKLFKGEDKCIGSANIPHFRLNLNDRIVDLKNGSVCICSFEGCKGNNGQGKIETGILFVITTTVLAAVV